MAVVACSDHPGGRASESTHADKNLAGTTSVPNPLPEPVAARAPLGGQALTGSVSGLSGVVTGFDVRRTDTQTIIDIAADVLFSFDSASLSAEAPEKLRRAAELIRQGGVGVVMVIGHTDAKGDEDYNRKLSLGRANEVVGWLSGPGGVPVNRLKPDGRGEAEPIASNLTANGRDDAEGRAKNRRVTIAIPR
jgi:outer membrane protein OmpA-like peptidoglycan-associated protein